ncbi:hypothetical protein HBI56_167580 [Parastagonospora nodorum]|nr:hypothetical protein HBI09_067160 [Parastagonospora nodorum]KAH4067400.1 hypothetical protein HBH50_139720 [Parastagonospora nodorum]KAH4077710.1 hypothetical protein HBH48_238600 [Parastagonospora nodorum]KAH4115880.1 hypothetical protein HBH47_177560 [Parastagonospora nodorum]KAH4220393.1 hypothetical protein HBI06_170940 [Parastagonospora nodorum]
MRLLRLEGDDGFSLVEFFGSDLPPYAILSHTWGADRDEVTFRDLTEGTGKEKAGYRKLALCRDQTAKDNLEYFWADTCCIDKSSSAELSEAINSMFAWYRKSVVCYAYLWDVMDKPPCGAEDTNRNAKECVCTPENWTNSRWFSRGWTLQELIGPKAVEFYSRDWSMIGTKATQSKRISQRTEIPERILNGDSLHSCSVAQRMSWAGGRSTKREEDEAYCLLGIFDMNMPLIYGEGKKSFVRLQLAILDQEEDYSILAWSRMKDDNSLTGLLASSPLDFSTKTHSGTRKTNRRRPQIPKVSYTKSTARAFFRRWVPQSNLPALLAVPYYRLLNTDYESLQSYVPSRAGLRTGEKLPDCISVKVPSVPVRATSRGLHLSLPVRMSDDPKVHSIAWIYCIYQGRLLCILLRQSDSTVFARHSPTWLFTVDAKFLKEFEMQEVYCHVSSPVIPMGGISGSSHVFHIGLAELGKTEEAAEIRRIRKESSKNRTKITKIRALISDLRHIDPANVTVLDRIDVWWLDRLKIYIEDKTASSWNWAPLQPPRRPCTTDLWHLEWKCVS